MFRIHLRALSALILLASAIPASADSVRVETLIVETPWARASIGTSRPAAAYLTIRNEGPSPDTLTRVETTVSAMAEIHKIETRNGVSTMEPAGPVEVPANGSIALAPGGLHVMLMKLQKPLARGERFQMTLVFEKAGRVAVTVPIYSVGASQPGD